MSGAGFQWVFGSGGVGPSSGGVWVSGVSGLERLGRFSPNMIGSEVDKRNNEKLLKVH